MSDGQVREEMATYRQYHVTCPSLQALCFHASSYVCEYYYESLLKKQMDCAFDSSNSCLSNDFKKMLT
jgi:hypothetical protein